MGDFQWCVLVILILTTSADCAVAAAECTAVEPLMTGDRFRVMDTSLSASSYLNSGHGSNEARLLRADSRGWCLGELLSIQPQWLEISFPVKVVIHTVSTAGSIDAYTLQYSVDRRPDTLEPYTEPDSPAAKIFLSGSGDGSTNATLHEPIVVWTLRIFPYSWSVNPPCLLVEVYGCPLKPVCEPEVNLHTLSGLLPPENIVSSTGESAAQLLEEDRYVCLPFNESTPPYFTLNFTHPVLLMRAETLFSISLADSSNVYETYVDSFTIATSQDASTFSVYTASSGEMEIQTDRVNTFWEPVRVYRYLRLTITAGQTALGLVCWHLRLFGCTAVPSEDNERLSTQDVNTSTLLLSSTVISMQQLTATPLSTALPDEVEKSVTVRKDYLIVEIVAPIAALTIMVVVTVCVSGVAICTQLKRTADYKLKLLTPPGGFTRYSVQSPTLTAPAERSILQEQERTIKAVHDSLHKSTAENPIEDSGVALSQNLSCEPVQFPAKTGAAHPPITELASMSLEAYEAGYEPVGTSPAQFELHEYDSIRLSQLYAPMPGADQSEYEMMESVQCLEDTATNKGLTNTQGDKDISLGVSNPLATD